MTRQQQFSEWLKEAKGWIEAAFAEFDMFDLAKQVSVVWNHRFSSKAGDASWFRKKIRLSSQLWERMSEQDRYETAVHEAAHIIARQLYQVRNIKPHGWEWKSVMIKCGVNPQRCHNFDTNGLRGSRKRYPATCRCQTHMITMNMVNKIRRGSNRICKRCKGKLILKEETIAACNSR